MDLNKLDHELVKLEVKDGMQYHIANRFVEMPWCFTGDGKSMYAGKLFFAIISMLDFTKDYYNQEFRFNIDEVSDAIGITRRGLERYELIKEALDTLAGQTVKVDIEGIVEKNSGEEVLKIHGVCPWISQGVVNSDTREAIVSLPTLLRPIILNLKNSAFKGSIQNAFNTLAPFRSHYFIHLYLLVVEKATYASKFNGYWKPSLDELYSLLCMKKSYCTWQTFKSRILEPFIEDIAQNDSIDFNVEYDPVYAAKGFGKGRRAVIAVKIWTVQKPSKIKTSKKEHDVHDEPGEATTDKYIPEAEEAVVDIELVSTSTKIKQKLLKYGVLDSIADKLINDYPEQLILEQIREFEYHDVWSVKYNAGAYLATKIENAFKQNTIVNNSKNEMFDRGVGRIGGTGTSTDFAAIMRANAEKAKQAEAEREAARQAELDRQAAEKEKIRQAAEARDKAINDIIESMTDEQKAAVIEKAKEKAPEFQKKMLEGKTFDELLSSGAHAALIKQTIEEFGVQQSIF